MVEIILEYSYTLVTILLLGYTLRLSLQETTVRHLKKSSYWIIFGTVFNLYSLSWLYTAYPLPWLQEGALQLLGIFMLHCILSLVAGLCFGIVYYRKYLPALFQRAHVQPLLFGISLSCAEILRSFAFSFLLQGEGSSLGLNWSAGTFGNALSTTPLIEYAYFGGTYMLTCILGYLVFICISKKNILVYSKHLFVIFVGLFFIHYGIPINEPKTSLTVGSINTNFLTQTKGEDITTTIKEQPTKVHEMTLELKDFNPDIIVYPEDTRYVRHLTALTNTELLSAFKDTLFIDGDTRKSERRLSNVTLFYSPQTKKLIQRGKSFLFPFNEYNPIFFKNLFSLIVGKESMEKYKEEHTYYPVASTFVYPFKGNRIATVICSEILSFQTLQKIKHERPSIVIYQSHLNVFHDNPWFVMHMRSFTKIAAAQLRTTIIGSSNNAPSYLISPYGEILDETKVGFSSAVYSFDGGSLEKIR